MDAAVCCFVSTTVARGLQTRCRDASRGACAVKHSRGLEHYISFQIVRKQCKVPIDLLYYLVQTKDCLSDRRMLHSSVESMV